MFELSAIDKSNSAAFLSAVRATLGLILLAAACAVGAACNPAQPLPSFYVGDTDSRSATYDAQCTHATLQDAIDAATCSYGTNIYLTHEKTYTNQAITIAGKNVNIIGRSAGQICGPPGICDPSVGCTQPPPGPRVSVGSGSGESVFTINGTGTSTVTLQYLDIAGATISGDGGGVHFDGTGTLTLDNTWIRGGHANNGGAIAFNGQNASTLTLGPNVVLAANQADTSGGGIAATGNATVNVLGPEAVIEDNLAPNGYGGGVYLFGAATANIASTNTTANPVLFQNRAAYGGGLAMVATNGPYDVSAQLFSTNPRVPVSVSSNQASHTGGGIYLKAFTNIAGVSYADFCAFDFRLYDNSAANGGAIYSDEDSSAFGDLGGNVNLNTCGFGGAARTALGATVCTNQALCNTIDSNTAIDADAAVILMQDKTTLNANRFSFIHNEGDYGIRAIDEGNGFTLRNCLFADNQTTHEMIYLNGDNTFTLSDCTFANDLIGSTHVIHAEHDISLMTSLFYEPGTLGLDYTGDISNIYVNFVVADDITSFPHSDAVVQGTAQFVDLANGDYHLAASSPGVDFSYTHNDFPSLPTVDRDNNPRDIDLPSVTNVNGPRDVGAYERQNLFRDCGTTDSIYCDGFGP